MTSGVSRSPPTAFTTLYPLSQLRCIISSLQTFGEIFGISMPRVSLRRNFSFLHSFNKYYLSLYCIPIAVYKIIAYTEESQQFNLKNVSKGGRRKLPLVSPSNFLGLGFSWSMSFVSTAFRAQELPKIHFSDLKCLCRIL